MFDALADNEITVEILLGIVLVWLVIFWWMRPGNKLLIAAASVFVLMIAFWFGNKLILTDRRQIDRNLHEMAYSIIHDQPQVLANHLAKDFTYNAQNRDNVKDAVIKQSKAHGLTGYKIWDMTFDKVSRPEAIADAAFAIRVDKEADILFMARCKTHFVYEVGQWRLQTAEFFPIYGNSNEAIHIPLP